MKISTDTYFICDRIKEIDDGYFIEYNRKTARFEVHNSKQGKDTLCAILPCHELDQRALDHINKTRVENFERLVAEMENNNDKLGGSYFALQ